MGFSFAKFFPLSVCLMILFSLLGFGFLVRAEDNLALECQWDKIEAGEKNLSQDNYRILLEKCKKFYEDKSVQMEKEIGQTANEKKTLSNTISLLAKKIKNLDYQIAQSNLMIKGLTAQISDTEVSIEKTNSKIDDAKERLSNLLQLRYEEDQKSTLEILLSEEKLSSFFSNLVALEALNIATQDILKDIKSLKSDLEQQKTDMDSEKKDLENTVIIQSLQKKDSAQKKGQQENLLKLTEQEYQKQLQEKKDAQEKAAKIGNKLFELLQVPEGGIKFEDAVEIAKSVSGQTGIRAAFSLAVLWQETKIGKLKGGCYLVNADNGDGVYIKSGQKAPRTMNPKRDAPLFLNLIAALNNAGFLKSDAYHTPVSCCMITNGQLFGWGGAMGPAQFIPSTWFLYKEAVEKKTGSSPANPWNVRDSFLANALYLKDLGAGNQTYQKEITAAMKYFGCTTSWCQQNYGKPVMTVSACFQDYIDHSSMSADCQDLVF